MTVAAPPLTSLAPHEPLPAPAAVLVRSCDGYAPGTVGRVTAQRQGCVEFAPDAPERVARWAVPRRTLLVPPSFVAAI